MLELIKIVCDLFVIRDATRKGQMGWRIWAVAIGFVLFLYGTAVPATILYQEHPGYKPLFMAALIVDGLLFVGFMVWGIRRYLRQCADPRSKS